MLVLSRKIQEAIVIGEGVRVTLLGISGGRVRIGIEAPGEVVVHRAEVHQRLARSSPGRDSSAQVPA